MQLVAKDRAEQGTPGGAMIFARDGKYTATRDKKNGTVTVTHEPRVIKRRVEVSPGKFVRKDMQETETVISEELFQQLLEHSAVAVKE